MLSLTRSKLIDRLRIYLMHLADEHHSVCQVAGRDGIFCKGFRRLSEEELRSRFDWIATSRSRLSRDELEDVINKYSLARTEALETPMACDAQMIDRDSCMGWDEFKDEDLARFHEAWFGEKVVLLPEQEAALAECNVADKQQSCCAAPQQKAPPKKAPA